MEQLSSNSTMLYLQKLVSSSESKHIIWCFILNLTPDPHANQFVNQGYNDIDFHQAQQGAKIVMIQNQKPQQDQHQQPAGTRIIPIKMEGSRSPQHDQTVIMQRWENDMN